MTIITSSQLSSLSALIQLGMSGACLLCPQPCKRALHVDSRNTNLPANKPVYRDPTFVQLYQFIAQTALTEVLFSERYEIFCLPFESVHALISFLCWFLLYKWSCICCVSKHKTNSVAVVRERTIPTEQLPLLGKVRANFCG
jgi:hypothetical protein